MTLVRFTPDDLAEMERLGYEKLANAQRRGTPHINRFRDDRIQGYVDGFKGEWAVADALGLPREPNVEGVADDGADVRLPSGEGINVRYTPYQTGRLMCPENRPMKTDWAVLVIGTPSPNEVQIIGGIRILRFYQIARSSDFGYGPTRFLEQNQLVPWERLSRGFLPSVH